MRSVTYRTEDMQRAKLTLGFVGENLHTRFIFDCTKDEIIKKFGTMTKEG